MFGKEDRKLNTLGPIPTRQRVPDWLWIVLLIGTMLAIGAWSWVK